MLTSHIAQYLTSYNEPISPITSLDSLYIEDSSLIFDDGAVKRYKISRISLLDSSMPIALIHDESLYNINYISNTISKYTDCYPTNNEQDLLPICVSTCYQQVMSNKSIRPNVVIDKALNASIYTVNLSEILKSFESKNSFEGTLGNIRNNCDNARDISIDEITNFYNQYDSSIQNILTTIDNSINDISILQAGYSYINVSLSDIKDCYNNASTFKPGYQYRFTITANDMKEPHRYNNQNNQSYQRNLETFAITEHLLTETCTEVNTGNILRIDFSSLKNSIDCSVDCYYMRDKINNNIAPFDHEKIQIVNNCLSNIFNNCQGICIKPSNDNIVINDSNNIEIGYGNNNITINSSNGFVKLYNNNSSCAIVGNNNTIYNSNSNIILYGDHNILQSNNNIIEQPSGTNYNYINSNYTIIGNNVLSNSNTTIRNVANSAIYGISKNFNSSDNNSVFFDGSIYAPKFYVN